MTDDDWKAFYGRCWDILVEHAGAHEDDRGLNRDQFVFHMMEDDDFGGCSEYRFCGVFGFGGKFRRNGNKNNTVYVDYYPENRTKKLDKVEAKTNAALQQAQEEMVGGPVFGCPTRHRKWLARVHEMQGDP